MKRSVGSKTLLFPCPVLVVGTYDPEERPNIMTAAWGGICCSQPPCLSISLRKATYTYGNLVARRAFTVSVPSEGQVGQADYVGIYSGRDQNKFEALGLTAVRGTHVDAPYVDEYPVILECEVIQVHEIGLHTLFVGQIMDVKIDDAVRGSRDSPDMEKWRPVSYAAGLRAYFGLGPYLGDGFKIGKKLGRRPG